MENNIIICICSYNRPDLLVHLFRDLANQFDQKFTVILLNDGGNIETRKKFKKIKFNFLYHYIETEKPSGLPKARNIILDYIKNKKIEKNTTYIAFIDDDITIKKDFIEKIKFYSKKYDGFCFQMIQKGISTTFDLKNFSLIQKIFSPIIGKVFPFLGIIFGGFYINSKNDKKIDHLVGCCLIYNFSKNKFNRFDLNLNEGNYVGEDTSFSYKLKKDGNNLYYIGSYNFIHNSPPIGGCKIDDRNKRFFWYWKHKLYIIKKYNGKIALYPAIFFCFWECIILSFVFRINLLKEFFKSLKIK